MERLPDNGTRKRSRTVPTGGWKRVGPLTYGHDWELRTQRLPTGSSGTDLSTWSATATRSQAARSKATRSRQVAVAEHTGLMNYEAFSAGLVASSLFLALTVLVSQRSSSTS